MVIMSPATGRSPIPWSIESRKNASNRSPIERNVDHALRVEQEQVMPGRHGDHVARDRAKPDPLVDRVEEERVEPIADRAERRSRAPRRTGAGDARPPW